MPREGLYTHLIPAVERTVSALAVIVRQEEQKRAATTSPPLGSTSVSSHESEEAIMCKDHRGNDSAACGEKKNAAASNKQPPTRFRPSPDNPGWTAKHHRRRFVQHNYHDHANDKTDPEEPNVSMPRGGISTPFPIVLHSMLEGVEVQGLDHIVSWQPHGRAFCVHDTNTFVRDVMSRFFRQSKISSFQRQLNLYGFCRLTNAGPDKGAYYHEFFLRGRPDLCVHMHRTRVKGTGVRTSSNPGAEPNFYDMSPVGKARDLKLPAGTNLLHPALLMAQPIPSHISFPRAPQRQPLAVTDITDVDDVQEMQRFLGDVDLSSDDESWQV